MKAIILAKDYFDVLISILTKDLCISFNKPLAWVFSVKLLC